MKKKIKNVTEDVTDVAEIIEDKKFLIEDVEWNEIGHKLLNKEWDITEEVVDKWYTAVVVDEVIVHKEDNKVGNISIRMKSRWKNFKSWDDYSVSKKTLKGIPKLKYNLI